MNDDVRILGAAMPSLQTVQTECLDSRVDSLYQADYLGTYKAKQPHKQTFLKLFKFSKPVGTVKQNF